MNFFDNSINFFLSLVVNFGLYFISIIAYKIPFLSLKSINSCEYSFVNKLLAAKRSLDQDEIDMSVFYVFI